MENKINNSTKKRTWILLIVSAIAMITIGIASYRLGSKKQTDFYRNAANLEVMKLTDETKHWIEVKDGFAKELMKTMTIKDSLTLSLTEQTEVVASLRNDVQKYKNQIKNGGSVTTFESNTIADIVMATEVEVDDSGNVIPNRPNNTQADPNIEGDFPTYRSRFNLGGWITGSVTANWDTITVSKLAIRNEYSIILGQDKIPGIKGWFKPKKDFALITSKNPYSTIAESKTYEVVAPKPKNKIKLFGVGIAIGAGAALLLLK